MQRIRIVALGAALVFGLAGSQAGAQQSQTAQDSTHHGRRGSVQGDQRRDGRRDGRRGGRAGRQGAQPGRALFRGITLTDAQKEQVRAIGEKYQTQRQSLRADVRADGANRPDSAEMARFRQFTAQQQTELRAALTPDQQSVFDKNVAEIRQRGEKRRKGK
ncbi:MAG TPA: Spy/CpxP family protein refolding chaperone [Gemmatimonadaceae bacterium]|nr:Spy/CpxP family protein refolding chaperone [Gemmatimonadaceae bacterium]